MSRERLLYTRAARVRLRMLPMEVQVQLETHLENLAHLILMKAMPEHLPGMLERTEDGFATRVLRARALLVVDTASRTVLVHRVEALPEPEAELEYTF